MGFGAGILRTGGCFMRMRHGLTTWTFGLGRVAVMWRWNMPFREAMRTYGLRSGGHGHGYATAGPLIVEW